MPNIKKMDHRDRNWCITIWDAKQLQTLKDISKYWIAGLEICPTTGRQHWQCYCEFANQRTKKSLCKKLPTSNIQARRGTQTEAINYCKKDGQWEEGGSKSSQGERTDLQVLKEQVLAGVSIKQLIIDNCPNYQQIRTIEKYKEYLSPQRDDNAEVLVEWFYGPTGTGKSLTARQTMIDKKLDYWVSNGDLTWWDGYDGQAGVILDDFRANNCSFSMLLRYLDRYHIKVPVKGGFRNLVATHIIVTSPFHPRDSYNKSLEDLTQLIRRISNIRYFPSDMENDSEVGGNIGPRLVSQKNMQTD